MADPAPPPPPRPPKAATGDRLRWEIDAGHTGDKVAFSDTAAAPLGTDDEAGGTPASRADVATAMAAEAPPSGGVHPRSNVRVGLAAMLTVFAAVVAMALGVPWRAP